MSGQDLVARESAYQGMQIPSDEEINRLFRLAKSFQMSGIYKDIKQAEAAFAKLIIGRDLGLTIAQSMQGVQFVQGQIQLHYSLLALVIRSRGYSWETIERSPERAAARFFGPDLPDAGEEVEFTMAEDARRIGKEGTEMYKKFPTNMLWARMMSNAVRFVIPEATGGIPVYVPGEIPSPQELTEGEGTGEIRGIELPREVEEVIARAEELGHQRHAERSVWEYLLDRGSDAVSVAVSEAAAELDELEKIKDAEVEPDVPIDMEGLPEPSPSPNVAEASRAAAEAETIAVEDETSEEVPAPEDVGPEVEEKEEVNVEALRRRLAELQKKKATTPEEEELRDEEVEWIESKLVAAAEKSADEDEDQGRLM